MEKTRIQKLLSRYGFFSRREVEKMIIEGRIKVNGQVANLGIKASTEDVIEINNKKINFNDKNFYYYLLNKPRGYISATKDKEEKTVVDLINTRKHIFPVGRLDFNTTGVLLLTNDGELSNYLTSPKNKVQKTYVLTINKPIDKFIYSKLMNGVVISGIKTKPLKQLIELKSNSRNQKLLITLIEGKSNQIKKMFDKFDIKVLTLHRKFFDKFSVEDLQWGEYKEISIDRNKYLNQN